MNNRSHVRHFLSLTISLGLLLQMLVPAWTLAPTASAAPYEAREQTTSLTPSALLTQPQALSQPLTVARVQSRYQAGGPVTIAYHIHNTLPPTQQPQVSAGESYTDTVDLLAVFSPEDDMNAVRDLTLQTTLAAGVTFVDSSLPVSQNNGQLTWQAGDLLPGATQVVTLTVQTPGGSGNFSSLDGGAEASGQLWQDAVSATARPAQLAPNSVAAATVAATVDADLHDEDMLWQMATVQQDPQAMFEYVRDLGYEPYEGSLRGTRGTLWAAAGSSLDQSSLLIAALRAAGVPARYRHGTLDVAEAQTLIASMFEPRAGVAGYVPDDAPIADPLNDGELLALAQDHWWVEAYLPGQGWMDLDPSFASATVGQAFATPGTHDRVAEIPNALRHTVTVSLTVEQHSAFPLGGTHLFSSTPLTGTIPIAQLAAKSLVLGHIVETNMVGGMAFSNVEHAYTPYFGINGDEWMLAGDTFSDLLTTFPLASTFTTAEWVTIAVDGPGGAGERFTRTVKDLIGPAARLGGGSVTTPAMDAEAPFIRFEDAFVINVLPHHLRQTQFADRQRVRLYYELLETVAQVQQLPRDGEFTPEEIELSQEAFVRLQQLRDVMFGLTGLQFARLADPHSDAMQNTLGVKMYYDLPRLIVMQDVESDEESKARTIDLRNTMARAVVVPGQSQAAAATAQWIKAVAESRFEGEALVEGAGTTIVTADHIFAEAEGQGIDFVYVTPDTSDLLDLYLPDPQAYGFAAQALVEGRSVLIPQAPVTVDGEPRLAWWEIDPQTGVAISVLDDGTHGAAIEYGIMLLKMGNKYRSTWKKFGLPVYKLWSCVVRAVVPAMAGEGGPGTDCLAGWKPPLYPPFFPTPPFAFDNLQAAQTSETLDSAALVDYDTTWFYLPEHLCPVGHCGIEQFVLPGSETAPMPLPDIAFQYDVDRPTPASHAGQMVAVSDNGSPGPRAFTLQATGSGRTVPQYSYRMDVSAAANFNGELAVWSYVPPGWSTGFTDASGVQIVAPKGATAGDYTILLVGQSTEDPALIATTTHTVTIPEQELLYLGVEAEAAITIPVGPDAGATTTQTNDGQAEIPNSAFRLELVNNSHLPKSIDLTVSGAPAGWIVLNGRQQASATVELQPFEYTRVGLYVVPTTLPAPGTSHTINVVASDGGSLSESVQIAWQMPGQAHNFMEAPPVIYVQPSGATPFELSMSNVGNTAGNFAIDVHSPLAGVTIPDLQTPLSLSAGESDTQTATLTVGEAELGRRYPLQFSSAAPDGYTQYALSEIQVVSADSMAFFAAADGCTVNDAVGAALGALATEVVELETWCSAGDCPVALRDRVVGAGEGVASYAATAAAPLVLPAVDDVQNATAQLATQTANEDIAAAVAGLSAAVSGLSDQLCQVEQAGSGVNGRLTPFIEAVLPGDSASFTLDVTNRGAVAMTYAITVTGAPDGDQLFSETVNAGDTASVPLTFNPVTLGQFDITAEIVATTPAFDFDVRHTANARLNVVDGFAQMTAVHVDPPFVETGASSTAVQVEIANFAGVSLEGVVEAAIVDEGGATQWSDTVALTVPGGAPALYDVATVDTSGWASGIYTVSADLLLDGSLSADSSAYGFLSVGQAVNAAHGVLPEVVAPGTVTVTTMITTAMSNPGTLGSLNAPLGELPWTVYGMARPETASMGDFEASTEDRVVTNDVGAADGDELLTPLVLDIEGAYFRVEEDEPEITYSGAWNSFSQNRASDGGYRRSTTAGDTAQMTFDGEWVTVGFLGGSYGGEVAISIDGQPQGVFDLYRREDFAPIQLTFAGLGAGSHTIELTVQGTANAYSFGTRVHVDYIDTWNGGALADGAFEENDARLLSSPGWSVVSNAGASGGSYASATAATAWFPFSGDSFSLQAMASSNAGAARLFVDGVYLDTIDLYAPVNSAAALARTFSYEGLGAGTHLLQIETYRGTATLDAVMTPGSAPFIDPHAPPAGMTRFEEDHGDMRYDGAPYDMMGPGWFTAANNHSSGGYNVWNNSAGSSWRMPFEGEWVNVGLRSSGTVEIFIDSVSQGVFDASAGFNNAFSLPFGGLAPGAHVVEVVAVSGTMMPDYIDVWDGAAQAGGWTDVQLPGSADDNVHFGNRAVLGTMASDYSYNGDTLVGAAGNSNVWFTFEGEALTVLGYTWGSTSLQVIVDGVDQGVFDMSRDLPFSNQPRSLHFTGLGQGAHVAQVVLQNGARLDALQVDAPDTANFVPELKWYDTAPATNGPAPYSNRGIMSTVALGDLNNDGLVELVAPASNGTLYVYRGDGQDAGGGSPLLWSTDVVGPAAEPALVDLSGNGNADIVVMGHLGTFAFTHDGTELWRNEDITSSRAGIFGWGGPSVGNLDLDPQPEIALAASGDALYVLDHEGDVQWSEPLSSEMPTVPVLADLNGDGRLDIVVGDGWELRAYDYANGGQLLWSYTLPDPNSGAGAYGSPAVADLTGDGNPEIVMNWGHRIQALRHDGTVLWTYQMPDDDFLYPSPVTVADTTGDGQLNIVTAAAAGGVIISNHHLTVLNQDGTLLWDQQVADNTPSASGVAAQDLTGNGAWEILWNGSSDGFLIFRGSDGQRLFNEPYTGSGTVLDYPALGDVDGDGVADVVLGGDEGLFVFSHVGRWIDSRPIWNQHTYHVTNINDNWSVPFAEPDSWLVHNTYRTQTPDLTPAPSYLVAVTHTVGLPDVSVLPATFAPTPTQAAPPQYVWQYQLEWYAPVNNILFDSVLSDMQPGETRQINQGSEVAYHLPSGWNRLQLPPLYVTAARLGDLSPAAQAVALGGSANFTLTLSNVSGAAMSYDLSARGVPQAWLDYPGSVVVGAGQTVDVTVTVHVPVTAAGGDISLWLDVENGAGGADSFGATLTLFEGLQMALAPATQTTETGLPLTYTLTISNLETVARTYDLAASGLASVTLPDSVSVAANGTAQATVTAVPTSEGPQPFTVHAAAAGGGAGQADGVAVGEGRYGVLVGFAPQSVTTGPGATAVYTVTVSNMGDAADDYALTVDVPTGWDAQLTRNGAPLDQLSIPARSFNSVPLTLLVTPGTGTSAGNYALSLQAQSLSRPEVTGEGEANAQVIARGVTVQIGPSGQVVDPTTPTSWDVVVTNTGSQADTFDLVASGAPALAGALPATSVSLAAGASQTVQLSAADLSFLMPGARTFAVMAQSQADGRIRAQDTATFDVAHFSDVRVAWEPDERTVQDALSTSLTLVVTNTGNTVADYQLTLSGAGLAAQAALQTVRLLPRSGVQIVVDVTANSGGVYQLTGAVSGAPVDTPGGATSGQATATVTFVVDDDGEPPNRAPVVEAGPSQSGSVFQRIQFDGDATDPDGDAFASIVWNFGDGNTASGSFTPSHVYEATGDYTVTLTVTDEHGAVGQDTLVVTVGAQQLMLPFFVNEP